jgi:hypothetical protein
MLIDLTAYLFAALLLLAVGAVAEMLVMRWCWRRWHRKNKERKR